ncbi:Hypothetical predicted protein [Podarcis lilfordi]|uniref:Uncharacterized protein n=1 Tax=Podarcis lilfordi TaxID=74358 RepID=A0AA35NVW4_9SAUR|nr:Hypothetical predicted protein [Podarcis lilfordi]
MFHESSHQPLLNGSDAHLAYLRGARAKIWWAPIGKKEKKKALGLCNSSFFLSVAAARLASVAVPGDCQSFPQIALEWYFGFFFLKGGHWKWPQMRQNNLFGCGLAESEWVQIRMQPLLFPSPPLHTRT